MYVVKTRANIGYLQTILALANIFFNIKMSSY